MICYEDILPGFLRGVGQLHPNLLVNLTSDSWFGADTEPWEHLALSVFASVELRVSMVRAVNSGVSALIDPNGRAAAENLRRRSVPQSARRRRRAGRGPHRAGRAYRLCGRRQSVRLSLHRGHRDPRADFAPSAAAETVALVIVGVRRYLGFDHGMLFELLERRSPRRAPAAHHAPPRRPSAALALRRRARCRALPLPTRR